MLNVALLTEGLRDLLLHRLLVIENIDLALSVTGAHLPLCAEGRDEWVHEVDAIAEAQLWHIFLREVEDSLLVHTSKLGVTPVPRQIKVRKWE